MKRLVPDGLRPLLRELPSLPTRRAILLGWAAPAPILVEVQEVPEELRPHSPDPAFWQVWTGEEERTIDWGKNRPILARWRIRSRRTPMRRRTEVKVRKMPTMRTELRVTVAKTDRGSTP